jgi:D-sedoheptulose 7-phosphate isomerase
VEQRVTNYFHVLGRLPLDTQVTDRQDKPVAFADAYDLLTMKIRATHNAGNKLMFIGNGGSAGIASHMAIDYSKNGGIRSTAFNDGAALTCLSNDLGYENVFAKQVELHARSGDMLVAISSSGKSPNILKACEEAVKSGCYILSLSGFGADNPLRKCGDLNFYVNSMEYGFVEITHLALIHAILDLEMGWGEKDEKASQSQPLLHVA